MADENEVESGGKKNGGGGGGLGPIIALVVVLAVGLGLGAFVALLFTANETTGDDEEEAVAQVGKMWERAKALELMDLLANVRGEQGRRYVKVTVQIWVKTDDHPDVSREEVTPILKEALEEQLHTFNLEELGREFIHTTLRKSFEDKLNQQLREIMGDTDPERGYVEKISLTGLLVQ